MQFAIIAEKRRRIFNDFDLGTSSFTSPHARMWSVLDRSFLIAFGSYQMQLEKSACLPFMRRPEIFLCGRGAPRNRGRAISARACPPAADGARGAAPPPRDGAPAARARAASAEVRRISPPRFARRRRGRHSARARRRTRGAQAARAGEEVGRQGGAAVARGEGRGEGGKGGACFLLLFPVPVLEGAGSPRGRGGRR